MSKTINHIKNFRYDINGLRAIAVTGVLLFHYKIIYFRGGFSGVDIFFVISGYLMSRIIINGINRNSFSILDFYGKRLKRIVPALLTLILVLTIVCFFCFFPVDYKTSERNAAASIAFLSNMLYWKTTNYFFDAADDNTLLHTWSLSVEWQFYLLYPFLLLGLNKLFKKKMQYMLCFICLTFLFFIGGIAWTKHDATASFYFLPTRAWEMLFGGVAFLSEDLIKEFKYKKYIAIAGYLLILLSIILLKSTSWPNIYTLAPVIATFMVIIANYNDFKLLQTKAVQFIGKISYSLYLWHWPVYVIALYIGIQTSLVNLIILMVIVTVLAYLSYRYVEINEYKSNKLILGTGLALLLITVSLSHFTTNNYLFKSSTSTISSYKEMHKKETNAQFAGSGCFLTKEKGDINNFNKSICINFDPNKKNILLLGDSHAAQYSQSFREVLLRKDIHLLQATSSGCLPIINSTGEPRCTVFMNYIFRDFVTNNAAKIDGVIIAANWVNNITDTARLISDLKTTIAFFARYKIKTLIIGQNETYKRNYPFLAAWQNEYNQDISYKYLDEDSYHINKYLNQKLLANYVNIYNVTSPKISNDIPYMIDKDHFSNYGAGMVCNKIMTNHITSNFINAIHKHH
ncbi:acyltransferase family protein [Mucilaginibacter sp. McL0603]|uniref:acyltransferase family protein n=1 Tax=Mucilaginibacter sp. McL0603 TaxID=3415670 RepID=UPI003CF5648F